MIKKIYIAGKITGMEAEAAKNFETAEKELTAQGYQAVNPMKLPHNHDKTWESYLGECIVALLRCDGIYLLPDWPESEGAILERLIAISRGMITIYQNQ